MARRRRVQLVSKAGAVQKPTVKDAHRQRRSPEWQDATSKGAVLDQLITDHREEIIARTRAKVASRSSPRPADAELDRGIPVFLDQLSETLRRSSSRSSTLDANAARHGGDLLRMGFTVSQVVHGYGDVCQAVTELALERDTPIATDEFRIFNRCLDEAIASAVTEYERQREALISRQGSERLGVLAHELRNALSAALLSFGTLRRGAIGPDSSTGAILNRSLLRLRDLIDRSLSRVRLEAGILHRERISIADLIEEVAITAAVEAATRRVSLSLAPIEPHLAVEGDRHLLLGAVENIVQNALKFTPPGGHVSLTIRATSSQILIDVADGCGGLPSGKLEELRGAFEQQGDARAGLGFGLWISRTSLRTMGGKLSAHDLPGTGCVFTAALPQLTSEPALTADEPQEPAWSYAQTRLPKG
jgi:signal transduction histidine kinase